MKPGDMVKIRTHGLSHDHGLMTPLQQVADAQRRRWRERDVQALVFAWWFVIAPIAGAVAYVAITSCN